ncbi:MAG: 30S ribosomal protein S10 [Candidatus Diapherotrites archaeon]
MQKARIKLSCTDYSLLNQISKQILEVAERTGVKHSGAIPLPTKKMVIATRKSSNGGGTESFERWHMRVHKRMIDIQADERTLRHIMRVEIPENVHVEIELKEN